MVTPHSLYKGEDKEKLLTLSIELEKKLVALEDNKLEDEVVKETESCKTPTGKEFMIPTPLECPPAPRKRSAPPLFSREALRKKPNFISDEVVAPELEAIMQHNQRNQQVSFCHYSPDKFSRNSPNDKISGNSSRKID